MNITTTFALLHTPTNKLLRMEKTAENSEEYGIEYEYSICHSNEEAIFETDSLWKACYLKTNSPRYTYQSETLPTITVNDACKVVAIHRMDNGLFYIDQNVPQTLEDIFGDFKNFITLASHDTLTHEVDEARLAQFKNAKLSKKDLSDLYASIGYDAWIELVHTNKAPTVEYDTTVFVSMLQDSLNSLEK
jgi:hypothetical protein